MYFLNLGVKGLILFDLSFSHEMAATFLVISPGFVVVKQLDPDFFR